MLVGTMRDVDYAAMASIDLTNGLPNEAKEALTKGNRTSGDLFTDMNKMLANDQGSLTALAAEAGKQTNGEIDVKLGESYLTYGRFDEAVDRTSQRHQEGRAEGLARRPNHARHRALSRGQEGGGADRVPQGGNGQQLCRTRCPYLGAVPPATSGLIALIA